MAAESPRTLLVVDDDPSIHELIQAMLAGEGWELDSAANGDEALARLEARAYDLVLTDILMPRMDGLTLLGHLRTRYPGARVVVMTVKNTPDHILGSLRREATAYVAKPLARTR
jgi:CheY-like chemotaxis protein